MSSQRCFVIQGCLFLLILLWLILPIEAQELREGRSPNENARAFETFALDNHIRVVALHVPDAPRQAMFSYLPLSLTIDHKAHAQWAHLLEHMLIRSNDPVGMGDDEIMIGGETSPTCMRLDTIALRERWREGIAKHMAWISARSFDTQTLEREKQNITGEEGAVNRSGHTGKFALAAWHQVATHGSNHVEVHGDVAGANIESVDQYAQQIVPIDDSILIATIGPIPTAELNEELNRTIGALEQSAGDLALPKPHPGELEATWDMATRNAILWWKLPDGEAETRATAHIIAYSLMLDSLGSEELKATFTSMTTWAPIGGAEGHYFIVEGTLRDGADAQQAREVIHHRLETIFDGRAMATNPLFIARQMAMQGDASTDFEAQRRFAPEHVRYMVEAQWLIQPATSACVIGVDLTRLGQILRSLTKESLQPLRETFLAEPAGSLLLEPSDS